MAPVAPLRFSSSTRGTSYDGLHVSGSFDWANVLSFLSLNFIFGFQNAVPDDDTLVLIEAGSFTGSIANVANGERLLTADGSGSFVVNYGSSS